jgi:ATP-dependent RNA helicase DHX29
LEIPLAHARRDRKPGEDNEEKVLSRLGITYGVLRRLGFTEERVEECIKAIGGVELEEAFDWVRDTMRHFG